MRLERRSGRGEALEALETSRREDACSAFPLSYAASWPAVSRADGGTHGMTHGDGAAGRMERPQSGRVAEAMSWDSIAVARIRRSLAPVAFLAAIACGSSAVQIEAPLPGRWTSAA